MFKQTNLLCTSMCVICFTALQGDQPGIASELELIAPLPETTQISLSKEESPALAEVPSFEAPIAAPPVIKKAKPKVAFKPFTGKVKGKKVRLRLQPDIESSIAKELQKGEFLSIVGEAEDFWIAEAPSDLKSYVFRSFVLDNQIEGTRVNIRLQPSLESPIVTHLNSGDPVQGSICAANNKWIEIPTPETARFYVAKDFIENFGGPEVKAHNENRLKSAKQQIETASYFVESEMQKAYPNIDFDKMNNSFLVVIQEYAEFPELVEQAKNSLAMAQEQFLDKRISFLENKASEDEALAFEAKKALTTEHSFTDKMKLWEPLEESLYLSWFNTNDSRNMDEYYEDQKLTATRISGILESYQAPVKCKPGDYIIRQNDMPVGYVYSTMINLQSLVGKKVTLVGAPRPNNNFAFPAYFILSSEN